VSTQSSHQVTGSATGAALASAKFDPRIAGYGRWSVSLVLFVTVVGIPLIPVWLLFSFWYYVEYLRRISATLTTRAVEIRQGVVFRKEATIPLNMITDVRLHDGPLMRLCGLRGLHIETAGQSGQNATSEGDLTGIVDAAAFRDAILTQRERLLQGQAAGTAPAEDAASTPAILAEIRDILARIEARGE